MHVHRFSENFLLKQGFAGGITNATADGTGVDTLGFRRAAFLIHIKTGSATTCQIGLAESADNSTFTTVNFLGTSNAVLQPATALVASSEGVYVLDIDLTCGRLRYIRPEIIGTGTAGDVEVLVALYQAQVSPPTQNNAAVSV